MTACGSGTTRSADGEELGPALLPKLVAAECGATVQFLDNRALDCPNCSIGVAVGAAEGLGDDSIDDTERLQVGRRDLHRFGGFRGLVGGPPQDRRAPLG